MPALAIGPRVRKSPFYDATIRHGARSFTVYNHTFMPMTYEADPAVEYWNLVDAVQVWDVGCERQVQIAGPDALRLAQLLTPRDVSGCQVGACKYTLITDHSGGIINDPLMLRLDEERFWFSLADSDVLLWAKAIAACHRLNVAVEEPDVSPLQVQGPRSRDLMRDLFGTWIDDLAFYRFREVQLDGIPLIVARGGYSKELCFEIYLRDARFGNELWDRLFEAGRPYDVSAGAPSQILRVEGGILSYNTDMNLSNNPFEINLGWTVDLAKDVNFIGKDALIRIRDGGIERRLLGATLDGPRMTQFNEEHWPAFVDDVAAGHLTTCAYSPRLDKNIAFVMTAIEYARAGQRIEIRSPQGAIEATLCELPFTKERKS